MLSDFIPSFFFFRLPSTSFSFVRILDFGYTFIATSFSTILYNLSGTPNYCIQNTILNRTVHYLLVYRPIYNLYPLFTLTPLSYLSLLYSSIFRLFSLKYKSVSLLFGFEL